MNPIDLIQERFDSFTKTEQTIALFILNNPNLFARQPIDTTVSDIGTSKPAMIRFAKKLGYNGYSEMRFDFSRFLISTSFSNPESPSGDDQTIVDITTNYIKFIEQINQTVKIQEVTTLANRIKDAKRSEVFALNRTALSAKQLHMRALKIGLSIHVTDQTILMGDVADFFDPQDLVIIFTVRDNAHCYARIIDTLTSSQVPVVLVTMAPSLPFAKKCTQVITLPAVFQGYATFIDEQVIFFVFVEILLHELAKVSDH